MTPFGPLNLHVVMGVMITAPVQLISAAFAAPIGYVAFDVFVLGIV